MELILAALAGCVAAVLTTPAGVSGAVFLLPVQVGLLGVPATVAAPTNLVFNVVAVPAGLAGMGRPVPAAAALARVVVAAAVPGMALGIALRATGVVHGAALRVLVAAVLIVVGLSLLFDRRPSRDRAPRMPGAAAVAAGAGVLGGLYGIGGGALLAPALVAMGAAVSLVAVPTLIVTLVTSAAGLGIQLAFVAAGHGSAPDWGIGLALGLGGLVGAFAGARAAPHVPRRALRAVLGAVAVAAGAMYLGLG